MNVHEYQAKALLRDYGVAVPEGKLASTAADAEDATRSLGTPVVVVKAQVHAGGRGKGGGVKPFMHPATSSPRCEGSSSTRSFSAAGSSFRMV